MDDDYDVDLYAGLDDDTPTQTQQPTPTPPDVSTSLQTPTLIDNSLLHSNTHDPHTHTPQHQDYYIPSDVANRMPPEELHALNPTLSTSIFIGELTWVRATLKPRKPSPSNNQNHSGQRTRISSLLSPPQDWNTLYIHGNLYFRNTSKTQSRGDVLTWSLLIPRVAQSSINSFPKCTNLHFDFRDFG